MQRRPAPQMFNRDRQAEQRRLRFRGRARELLHDNFLQRQAGPEFRPIPDGALNRGAVELLMGMAVEMQGIRVGLEGGEGAEAGRPSVQHIIRRLVDECGQDERAVQHGLTSVKLDADVLTYIENDENKPGIFRCGIPLTPEHNYFEVEVIDSGLNNDISVGLSSTAGPSSQHNGLSNESISLNLRNGHLHKSVGPGRPFGSACEVGDRVGCGIKFEQVTEEAAFKHVLPVFFTKNAKEVGTVLVPLPLTGFYPAVVLRSEGEEVRLALDLTWRCHGDTSMCVDNVEDEWSRFHDIRLNGQVLEYMGRGKSIADVGLAQARRPLTTQHHYFELEIVDQGDSCYIAIGVARKNYPKDRHPGWNKGSVAYHADDGKIFLGCGTGDPFGPKCSKGDIMGCGIFFPRDFHATHGSRLDAASPAGDAGPRFASARVDDAAVPAANGVRGKAAVQNGVFLPQDYDPSAPEKDEGLSDSDREETEEEEWEDEVDVANAFEDSDSDEYYQRGNAPRAEEKLTKVKVFFTRNGKLIGHRETWMPVSGFYPTVGMLSCDEKVRVDLHPLTG